MAFQDIPSRAWRTSPTPSTIFKRSWRASRSTTIGATPCCGSAERSVEIISEASRHIPPDLKAQHPTATWRNIADIGNVLRHAYPSVKPEIVWEVATLHVTPLRAAVAAMLAEVEPEDDD